MAEKKGFLNAANKFFQRVQNKDLIRAGSNNIVTMNNPASEEEVKRKTEFAVFRQYLQQKAISTNHTSLYGEYRRMDETYPIISTALKIYMEETCLTGDTIINLPQGEITIKELYNQKKTLFYLHSYDKKFKRIEWNMCSHIVNNGYKDVYEVEVELNIPSDIKEEVETKERAVFKCTHNHKIMIENNSFKELKELKEGDLIFSYYKYKDPECNCTQNKFQSSRILSIKKLEVQEEVYDLLNVESNNHFSIKVSDTLYVEVHNCTQNSDGNILEINSENQEIKKVLEDLFFNKLKINSQGYLLVKEMLKFGNLWAFINTRRGEGVTDLIYLPPEQVRFEYQSNAENLDDFSYIWSGSGTGRKFEPWEVVHFKNIEDLSLQPYGTSILRSVVDTWRRIILMREALIIYRITRAPQRMLFKIDTSGMDADAALNYANEIKKSMYKKPMQNSKGEIDFSVNPISIEENIYMPTFSDDVSGVELLQGAGNLGDVEDYKIIKEDLFAGLIIPKSFLTFEESLCHSFDTQVDMLSNERKTMLELAKDFENGVENYVYSTDEFGNITPGKITWAGKTKTVSSYYEIILDNEEVIKCTDNHFLMLRDGTYKRADELVEGESLMPLYKKVTEKKKNKASGSGYEMVWHNGKQKWELTHQMVVKNIDENFYKRKSDKEKRICHHKNHNKRNNHPNNLENVSQKEHSNYHKEIAYKNLCSPESRAKLYNKQQTLEYKKKLSDSLKKDFDLKNLTLYREKYESEILFNHKIKSINIIEEEMDMYDITVDKYHNFALSAGVFSHNCLHPSTKLITTEGVISIEELSEIMKEETSKKRYVLSINNLNLITAGKILKCYKTKSVKELYEITLTDGAIINCTSNHPFLLGDGTTYVEAEKLQIGQSLRGNLENKIYEVKYITIKYFDDLVDVYDLEVDIHHNFALESGIFVHNSNKNALRQEDLRFSNAIKRHQASFVEGLIHIAIVHLNLLGFSKKELESFTINMATNSKELEKIELEILQQRIDLAKNILDVGNGQLTLMSFTQVLRDILKFSDAEIEETLENLIIEKRITWRLTKLVEDGFFEEPEKNKLDSKLSDISKDEILSKLKFENTELISPIKTILTRKVKEDVKFLIEGKKTKVTKKQLKTIIGTFKTKYGKELEE